jgi:tetratricopeptide (TPR) repeat protein
MNNYEFWDELGKIFNAVVAYQEKSVEFNKRFINPWIRLGNVFDKQDRNMEAIGIYQKAIEIDPANAQNWYELGNVYFRMDTYAESAEAYNKAIELDPGSGWSFNNLALTYVTQGKYSDAIPLYQKSIELLRDPKDRAIAWNRLGNAYRKLNEYDLAVQAFQAADDLDGENAGFRDELDDAQEEPTLVEARVDENPDPSASANIELVLSAETPEPINGFGSPSGSQEPALNLEDPPLQDPAVALQATKVKLEPSDDLRPENGVQADNIESGLATEAGPEAVGQQSQAAVSELIPVTEVSQTSAGREADAPMSAAAEPEVSAAAADARPLDKEVEESIPSTAKSSVQSTEASPSGDSSNPVAVQADIDNLIKSAAVIYSVGEQGVVARRILEDAPGAESTDAEITQPVAETWRRIDAPESAYPSEAVAESVNPEETLEPFAEELAAWALVAQEGGNQGNVADPISEETAYDEFLEDNDETLDNFATQAENDMAVSQEPPVVQEPVTKIDSSGDIQIEVDTKNAHVWNELGNVYFNARSFEDAIVAYSKAIELDRWFAWPYSNLALAYVQKARFAEAILLYQRSIELFSSEKDKAISWNRLGNVYRRLNDYDNAISAYQRADDLDPDNTTLSLQSRFSLLGNYYAEQKPSYIS